MTASGSVSRRGLLVLSGTVVGASTVPTAVAAPASRDTGVPTWQAVNGFPLGSRQASVEEIDTYVRAVAASSSRVRVRRIGTSVEGRPIYSVVVTSARNLRRLPALQRAARRLRDAPTTRAAAEAGAAVLPAFVIAIANTHGNEPSGADALMQVLYDLASGTDGATRRRLDKIVLVISPTQNPDGRVAGARPNARGFDLNRDWFAMTQPESPPRVKLFRDYPAAVGLDLHEQFFQGPDAYFFPPNADPVHREVSRPGLRLANDVLSPAIAKRFDREGWTYSHYGIYDLFAPIYGDSVPNQAFGAAGFLMEVAFEEQYATKFAKVHAALDATLDAVVQHRRPLMVAWARQWVTARAEGERGTLRRNFVQDPAAAQPLPASQKKIYGYVVRADRRAGDVSHLVRRLLAYGVQVHVTRRGIRAPHVRAFGGDRFTSTWLPAGTILVTAAQPMKSWVHLLLADDPQAPVNYFYDVSGWGNGLLMRLDGGALGAPVASWFADGAVRRVRRLDDLRPKAQRRKDSAGYAFAVDSTTAQRAVFELLAAGVAVRRTDVRTRGLAAGTAVVPERAFAALARTAGRLGLPVRPVRALPPAERTTTLRRPRVALVRDLVSDVLEPLFARSSGYAEWLLATRFGLDVTSLYAHEVDAGSLLLADLEGHGYDAVVVPDGFATVLPGDYPNLNLSLPAAGMTPVGLLQLNTFVRSGGTYVGWGQQGFTTAKLAGVAGDMTMSVPLTGVDVPGSPFGVHVHGGDPATLGLEGTSTVYNFRDPVLGGGMPLVTYPAQVRSYGFATGIETLAGTVAASGLHVERGRSYLCAFDPAFRGWSEATQALVGNMLLAPQPGAGGSPAQVPGLGALSTLSASMRGGRATVVQVDAPDSAVLHAVVTALDGLPGSFSWRELGDGSLELRVPDTRTLAGHPPAWLRTLLERLAAAGVRPTMVLA